MNDKAWNAVPCKTPPTEIPYEKAMHSLKNIPFAVFHLPEARALKYAEEDMRYWTLSDDEYMAKRHPNLTFPLNHG